MPLWQRQEVQEVLRSGGLDAVVPDKIITPMQKLLAGPVRPGSLVWIGLRSERQAPPITPDSAELIARTGIVGDRYKTSSDGARQVTLIATESLAAIAAFLGKEFVDPRDLRRNLMTKGINLQALKGRRFRVGAAVLETTGECAPCGRMEVTLGAGGYNAVRGHGGITARIVGSGVVRLGDAIERLDPV